MAGRPGQSSRLVRDLQRSNQQLHGPRPVRLGTATRKAVLMIMRYIALATASEPTQEEIATVLKSYFTLNEVANQISYLRKNPADGDEKDIDSGDRTVSLRVNLGARPPKNSLARAGFFIPPIGEGIAAIRRHARAMHGVEPSEDEVARSLMSSFILSELKNQIVHSRRQRFKESA
jgi:hypothetical protein